MRTGVAHLPLHGGRAPAWLFARMVRLAREICGFVVSEWGPEEMLRRLSDPHWFQAMGCVLGFDWHSSGLTTTACGALKEAVRGHEQDFGFYVAGGKGKVSRQTPAEIVDHIEGHSLSLSPERLVYASRMSAKVDSSAVQDGYQVYHHSFLFTKGGTWAVVQQGMNEQNGWARRYHWLSEAVQDWVDEPHAAVEGQAGLPVLNLVAHEGESNRATSTWLAQQPVKSVMQELDRITRLELPGRHELKLKDLHPRSLEKIFLKTYEAQAPTFEKLLSLPGVGASTLRALSLVSELIYDAPASRRDPLKYAYAHGGKDGTPFPVNRADYDRTIETLHSALKSAKLGHTEKTDALRRLSQFASP